MTEPAALVLSDRLARIQELPDLKALMTESIRRLLTERSSPHV